MNLPKETEDRPHITVRLIVEGALGTLLNTKHLYQSVHISFAEVWEIVGISEPPISFESQLKRRRACC